MINYICQVEMTKEEKIEMYMKLSKKDLVHLLLNNQELLEEFTQANKSLFFKNPFEGQEIQPNIWYENPWWGTNHPITGEPLGPTYETIT